MRPQASSSRIPALAQSSSGSSSEDGEEGAQRTAAAVAAEAARDAICVGISWQRGGRARACLCRRSLAPFRDLPPPLPPPPVIPASQGTPPVRVGRLLCARPTLAGVSVGAVVLIIMDASSFFRRALVNAFLAAASCVAPSSSSDTRRPCPAFLSFNMYRLSLVHTLCRPLRSRGKARTGAITLAQVAHVGPYFAARVMLLIFLFAPEVSGYGSVAGANLWTVLLSGG